MCQAGIIHREVKSLNSRPCPCCPGASGPSCGVERDGGYLASWCTAPCPQSQAGVGKQTDHIFSWDRTFPVSSREDLGVYEIVPGGSNAVVPVGGAVCGGAGLGTPRHSGASSWAAPGSVSWAGATRQELQLVHGAGGWGQFPHPGMGKIWRGGPFGPLWLFQACLPWAALPQGAGLGPGSGAAQAHGLASQRWECGGPYTRSRGAEGRAVRTNRAKEVGGWLGTAHSPRTSRERRWEVTTLQPRVRIALGTGQCQGPWRADGTSSVLHVPEQDATFNSGFPSLLRGSSCSPNSVFLPPLPPRIAETLQIYPNSPDQGCTQIQSNPYL